MQRDSQTWPRQYARQIIALTTVEERRAALANVPEHLRPLTKRHVEIAFEQRNKGLKA